VTSLASAHNTVVQVQEIACIGKEGDNLATSEMRRTSELFA